MLDDWVAELPVRLGDGLLLVVLVSDGCPLEDGAWLDPPEVCATELSGPVDEPH